jgi:large subunit ribosomal protein L9
MKLILKEAVAHLGEPGEIVEVKRGYARNFLLPKGMAIEATPANLRAIEFEIEKLKDLAAEKRSKAQAEANKLSQEEFAFIRKVVDPAEGSLYGSVSVVDLHDAIAQRGYKVEKGEIHLEQPVKMLGEFEVAVTIAHGVDATVKFTIVGEQGETAPEPVEEAAPEPKRVEAEGEEESEDEGAEEEAEAVEDEAEAEASTDVDDEAAEYAV